LLGEAAQPAKAAVTVLQLQYKSPAAGALPVADAGTVMRCGDLNPPLLFTLSEDVALLALVQNQLPVQVSVNGADRTPDLARGYPIALMDRGADAATVEFAITLESAFTPPAKPVPISMLIELDVSGDIAPEWLARPGNDVDPPATLTWRYYNNLQGDPVDFA